MAMPAVGLPKPPVPQTTTPRSFSASMSNEALRMPEVSSSFSFGSASTVSRRNGVRSRIAQTMSKSFSALMTLDASPRCSLKTVMSALPLSADQSAILRATF